ncbi:hypothetical protein [Azospirillum aestuarii]
MPEDLQAFIHETRKTITALKPNIARTPPGRHGDAGRAAKTAIR